MATGHDDISLYYTNTAARQKSASVLLASASWGKVHLSARSLVVADVQRCLPARMLLTTQLIARSAQVIAVPRSLVQQQMLRLLP